METIKQNNDAPAQQFDAYRTVLETFCAQVTTMAELFGLPYRAELRRIPGREALEQGEDLDQLSRALGWIV